MDGYFSLSVSVIESESFCKLTSLQQVAYIHMVSEARANGIVINARTIARFFGGGIEDINALVSSGFLSPYREHFKIAHWKKHCGIGANAEERKTYEYKKWRNAVIERDGRCVECGSKESLVAHHIKPFADYPELRTEISNGVTLCRKCHIETHRRKVNG